MRENRPYGSEGGEANASPTPIGGEKLCGLLVRPPAEGKPRGTRAPAGLWGGARRNLPEPGERAGGK